MELVREYLPSYRGTVRSSYSWGALVHFVCIAYPLRYILTIVEGFWGLEGYYPYYFSFLNEELLESLLSSAW